MSWFDISFRRAALSALLLLSACGFEPVYGPGAEGLTGQVIVEEPGSREAFVLVRALERRLGRAEGAGYRLETDLDVTEDAAALTPDRQITRFTLTGSARWRLFDQAGVLVATGEARSFTAYSATGTTAETLANEADARDRLSDILAERIVTELLAAVP